MLFIYLSIYLFSVIYIFIVFLGRGGQGGLKFKKMKRTLRHSTQLTAPLTAPVTAPVGCSAALDGERGGGGPKP